VASCSGQHFEGLRWGFACFAAFTGKICAAFAPNPIQAGSLVAYCLKKWTSDEKTARRQCLLRVNFSK